MDYFDDWGLVNSRPDEKNAENALLWSMELLILLKEIGIRDEMLIGNIDHAIKVCRRSSGLFEQNPEFSVTPPLNEKDKYMSRDQLIAICCFSYLYDKTFHLEVWDQLIKQKLRYSNYPESKPNRFLQPADIIFIGCLKTNYICKLLSPILGVAMIVSCLADVSKTSGKLLTYVRLATLKTPFFKMVNLICKLLIVRKHGNWGNVFKTYFPLPNHPITKATDELYE